MKNGVIKISLIVFALLFIFRLNAQERVVKGKITTLDSIPLMSVKIEVASTNQIVLSDSLGNFSVNCNNKDKLKVTAKGFYCQRIKLTGNTSFTAIDLKLRSGESNLENAFVYLNASNIDALKAYSITDNELDFSSYCTIYELIPGRIPGVDIVYEEIPGLGVVGQFRMRGTRSITGNNGALILVDGVPTDFQSLSFIPTYDVKSLTLLKGSKAAIYGSNAANGVIAIETKRGVN